jgi:hypothetical protein
VPVNFFPPAPIVLPPRLAHSWSFRYHAVIPSTVLIVGTPQYCGSMNWPRLQGDDRELADRVHPAERG